MNGVFVAWPAQRKLSWRVSEKKKFHEAEEIASLDIGAKNQYSSINFLGQFIVYLKFFVANVRDFYTVAFGCGQS